MMIFIGYVEASLWTLKSYGDFYLLYRRFKTEVTMERIFGFIGGDRRQLYAAQSLKNRGYRVKVFLMEECKNECEESIYEPDIGKLKKCTDIVFPLPVTIQDGFLNTPFMEEKTKLEDCVKIIRKGANIYGGKLNNNDVNVFESHDFNAVDYLDREDFKILNAIPTAEGALAIAADEKPITIFGSKCLVTGFGCLGRAMCSRLKDLGADVTVVARKSSSREEARSAGINSLTFDCLESVCPKQDFIFNTVPKKYFAGKVLENIKSNTLIIDLASKPGGVDLEKAGEHGINVIWALSIPGKYSPITAGKIIADIVLNILDEIYE